MQIINPAVIAFSGKRGSGKSTAAAALIEWGGFVDIKFAGPLKDMLRGFYRKHNLSYDIIERKLEGDLKEEECAYIARFFPNEPINSDVLDYMMFQFFLSVSNFDARTAAKFMCEDRYKKTDWLMGKTPAEAIHRLSTKWHPGTTPRTAMQQLGTEWRDTIDTTLWSEIFVRRVTSGQYGDKIVCSDFRFPHEAEALHRVGGIIYKIVRPDAYLDRFSAHPSEALTDSLPFDDVIVNDEGVDKLQRIVLDKVGLGVT